MDFKGKVLSNCVRYVEFMTQEMSRFRVRRLPVRNTETIFELPG